MVNWLTSASSGKWKVVKARPTGRWGSTATVISIVPRRDETRIRSPAATPRATASVEDKSRAWPLRIGES